MNDHELASLYSFWAQYNRKLEADSATPRKATGNVDHAGREYFRGRAEVFEAVAKALRSSLEERNQLLFTARCYGWGKEAARD